MDATGTTPFGIGRLFLADSRIAFAVLNEARHRSLHRVFGVPREQENVLTLVVAATAASATYAGARRVMRVPMRISGGECAAGAMLLRQAAAGVAGPTASATPMFGSLMAFAVVGGLALPGLRRAAHTARLAEHRAREHRIARYLAARRPAAS